MADHPPVPAEFPDWATNGSPTAIDTPFASLARTQVGWELSDKPSPNTQNGLHFWTAAWLTYLQDIQNHSEVYEPFLAGVALADHSVRRGWYRRYGGSPAIVDVAVQVTWDNVINGPGNAGDTVDINLPYQTAALPAGPNPPFSWSNACDPVGSIWPDKATDRAIRMMVNNVAAVGIMQVQRVSTTNTSAGFVLVDDNVSTQIWGAVRYVTDGTYLL